MRLVGGQQVADIAHRGLRATAAKWLALASWAATNFHHWLMRRGNTCSTVRTHNGIRDPLKLDVRTARSRDGEMAWPQGAS